MSLQTGTRFFKFVGDFDVLRASLPLQKTDSSNSLQHVYDARVLLKGHCLKLVKVQE